MTNTDCKNIITELVFILDRSGSMGGLERDTIGGFNSMLEKQKKTPGKTLVSTVLFDHESIVLHDRIPLSDVRPMTEDDYVPRGSTALFDAVGDAIRHIGTIHKYACPEDVPAKTLFVITTDGMENASRRYDRADIRRMIDRQTKQYGWEFLFLGANIDAAETAESIGICRERAVDFIADAAGTKKNYAAVNDAVSQIRACAPLGQAWRAELDRDFKKRRGASRR